MAFRAEAITILPAIILFVLSSYLAFFSSQVDDPSVQKALLTVALGIFLGGVVLAICWGYYWAISKRF
jgi:uncharacterized membrane protein